MAKAASMTSWTVLMMIVFSVSCSAIAQILLKNGMAQPATQHALAGGDFWLVTRSIGADPSILSGFMLYGLGAVIWLFVLARLDVSVAYPFVALGFLMTMTLGCLLFGEALTLRKVMGTLIVALGVYLVATAK
jgi:drug/metabolite transporter (DMT)-like permease